jgi:hypothetical protein
VARAVQAERAGGDPGAEPAAEPDPGDRHVEPAITSKVACSHTQRSACWTPQLWPTIAGQPSSSTRRPSTVASPVARVAGWGLQSLVRGRGAAYSQARGRWASGGSPPSSRTSQLASRPAAAALPAAWSGVRRLPPMPM